MTTRAAKSPLRARDLDHDAAEPVLRRCHGRARQIELRHRQRRRQANPRRRALRHRHRSDECLELGFRNVEAREPLPFFAVGNSLARFVARHLRRIHQSRVIILVACERQAHALDRVSDEAVRQIVAHLIERLDDELHVVPGEIGHERVERGIVMRLEQARDAGLRGKIGGKPTAPRSAALKRERRIKIVRAFVDPALQGRAARSRECRLEPLAVFERHHLPADRREEFLNLLEQMIVDDAVEALAVVVDDPPHVPHVVLPALEQRLEHVALVELGIAHERDHAARGAALGHHAVEPHIVLHERGEERVADAEPDRAGREIDLRLVLGARGIGLGAAERAKFLERLAALPAEKILDGVEDRRRVRLHREPILRPQRVEIERGHHGHRRRAARLMAADLEPVAVLAHMVRVMDRPGREPQHLALQGAQQREARGGCRLRSGLGERHRALIANRPRAWRVDCARPRDGRSIPRRHRG